MTDHRDESGFTLVELALSLVGLSLISALMVSWFVGVNRVDRAQEDADSSARQAMMVREEITRDLRRARAVTTATATEVGVWLDDDGDEVADAGESVSWRITSNGSLLRSIEDAGVVRGTGLDLMASGFTYDAGDPALITRIDVLITFVAGDSARAVDTSIYLRNA